MRVSVDGGKYTYVITETNAHVLRYGELWKDATGDKFTYSMAAEIEYLREQVEKLTKERDIKEHCITQFELEDLRMKEQLVVFAEQNAKMRDTLDRHFKCECCCLHDGDMECLSLPDLASPVLNRIKAEAYREAAELVEAQSRQIR